MMSIYSYLSIDGNDLAEWNPRVYSESNYLTLAPGWG